MPDENLIACCGLDCGRCDMRAATGDPELQQKYARWFKEHLHQDIDPADIGCTWCRGSRKGHWSADCWILACCVDRRGRESCATCPEFPCPQLRDWSEQNERYRAALGRLREMRERYEHP